MKTIVFVDCETNSDGKPVDFGATRGRGDVIHIGVPGDFCEYISQSDFICGHNIIRHDWKLLEPLICIRAGQIPGECKFSAGKNIIDTLPLSPLLFPRRPYHGLLKDDKFSADELNNPANDAVKAMQLFHEEVTAFSKLPGSLRSIYLSLLKEEADFSSFFNYIDATGSEAVSPADIAGQITTFFNGKLCKNSGLEEIIMTSPVELAYCLALIDVNDDYSISPPWVIKQFPAVMNVMRKLTGSPCASCDYCDEKLDSIKALKKYFGYDDFLSYEGKPLQREAVEAAIRGESLLAVFPTGGGKSLTFQVPALMAGKNAKALTIVISPLQSLMKDQVDNLEAFSITDSVTINGLLDPVERAESIRRVEEGEANILYIAPEMLRSAMVSRLLAGRNIERFVIDEAHCFSVWGQDFRVDYLYIGEFIRDLQEKRGLDRDIPVSCFTATAKRQVIEDIQGYFKDELNLNLKLFHTPAGRKNLEYHVIQCEDSEKYETVRAMLGENRTPTIIYVARTKRAEEIAFRLTQDDCPALPFHGRMKRHEKNKNQEAFINGDAEVIVATSAFGMGVNKKDVGRIIHYDISDSLENYVQESGRAGRDENIHADCYILYNQNDLNKHFILLNQTKVGISEIRQVWRAIKNATKYRSTLTTSARELARDAGWDETILDIETRVKTAVAALENAGYVKRKQNAPQVFADSIAVKNMEEASRKIEKSEALKSMEPDATRIINYLISRRSNIGIDETQVDVMSESLAIDKSKVIDILVQFRSDGILADAKDLIVYLDQDRAAKSGEHLLDEFIRLEIFVYTAAIQSRGAVNLKELNDEAQNAGIETSKPKRIRSIFNFWATRNMVRQESSELNRDYLRLGFKTGSKDFLDEMTVRHSAAKTILRYVNNNSKRQTDGALVFSILDLITICNDNLQIEFSANAGLGVSVISREIARKDVESAILYLSRIGALRIEGGFLVLYNALRIERVRQGARARYKTEDYENLRVFYEQKMQMIHIVGEYAEKVVQDYEGALGFANDYFMMDYSAFLKKYFSGVRGKEIKRNLTPGYFKQIFGSLSAEQLKIINSQNAKVVVAAGPGSGKTRVLVHKLVSLLIMEDVRHEQLLMLTFSRAAATEFKSRLIELLGNATHANLVEIKTFHSYAFDLLGQVGDLNRSDEVLMQAAAAIENGAVEPYRVAKSVIVIDEAQDLDANAFRLIQALIDANEGMRVIAVGDDDQNIYEFRGSDSKYLRMLAESAGTAYYELVENYRSRANLVAFTNTFQQTFQDRLKKTPIMPKTSEEGHIALVHYMGGNLVEPVVKHVCGMNIIGSLCVMTKTNEEALLMNTMLNANGIASKLIQGGGRYNLQDLQELRFFTNRLGLKEGVPLIDSDSWKEAKEALAYHFKSSPVLPLALQMLKDYESINKKHKYVSDFRQFVRESAEEDFYHETESGVYVSTIHKSKGREFDHVIMMLEDYRAVAEKDKRALYVGMTRARESLTIHFNNTRWFEQFQDIARQQELNLAYREDPENYTAPDTIALALGHQDVFLSWFKGAGRATRNLRSGDALTVDLEEGGCKNTDGQLVMKFSNRFSEELRGWAEKGYRPVAGSVNRMLYWHEADQPEDECLIVLPRIECRKQ